MAACTKCGGGTISGPTYGRGDHGQEWLSYRCNRCGYGYRTATKEESATIEARTKFFALTVKRFAHPSRQGTRES